MDKASYVHTILFSLKYNLHSILTHATTGINLEDIHAKGSKPVTEGQMLYDSAYMGTQE